MQKSDGKYNVQGNYYEHESVVSFKNRRDVIEYKTNTNWKGDSFFKLMARAIFRQK